MPDNTQLSTIDTSDPDLFARGLLLRQENRQELLSWVKANLVKDRDYGHLKDSSGKDKGSIASLWQPGAQQICGLLGLRPHFPDSEKYVDMAVRGEKIDQVVVRCLLYNAAGEVIGEGMGARSAISLVRKWEWVDGSRKPVGEETKYDVNYALKMAQKSAHIDATLRAGGLSAIFTQDQPPEDKVEDETLFADHPTELAYLELKATELFGDQSKGVLEAFALKRMRITDGDYTKIRFKHFDYTIHALEARAELVAE